MTIDYRSTVIFSTVRIQFLTAWRIIKLQIKFRRSRSINWPRVTVTREAVSNASDRFRGLASIANGAIRLRGFHLIPRSYFISVDALVKGNTYGNVDNKSSLNISSSTVLCVHVTRTSTRISRYRGFRLARSFKVRSSTRLYRL